MRPCWNRFTLSEFICLLIVTVGIPRRNCKTPKHKHTNIRQNKHWFWCEMLNMFAFCWIMFTTSILGSLRSGGSYANWSIGHPFPLRHWSRCSVACIPAATVVSRVIFLFPLDTTHLDPWVKRISLLLLQYLPGCCRCYSPSIPCINSTPSLSALVALRNVKTRLSRQANVMSKWSDILRSLYSCGTCGPPLTFIYGSSTAVQATV